MQVLLLFLWFFVIKTRPKHFIKRGRIRIGIKAKETLIDQSRVSTEQGVRHNPKGNNNNKYQKLQP